jgi:hypothetical protein
MVEHSVVERSVVERSVVERSVVESSVVGDALRAGSRRQEQKVEYYHFAAELLCSKFGMLHGKPAFASEPFCPFSAELQRW